jgi:uncharacterized protein GlcG (DUF336 family)
MREMIEWHSRCVLSVLALAICCGGETGCGSGSKAVPTIVPNTKSNLLEQSEVDLIVTAAASAVDVPLVIAVSDRRGQILAVYHKENAPLMATSNFGAVVLADDQAAALARTAAFFSNDQAPIGSRTVRFLSGVHFPPGVRNAESAPLYGIENTNRGCGFNIDSRYLPGQTFAPTTLLSGAKPGLGIQTGKANTLDSDPTAVDPGGVPIFKNGRVAGGIGIAGASAAVREYAAVAATVNNGFAPNVPSPGAVILGGITLPFVMQTTIPAGINPGAPDGAYTVGPGPGSGPAPEGDLIQESGSAMGGLTLSQVQQIVRQTIDTGSRTRAAIRLPAGSRASFVIAVSDLDGTLLALYRMQDATVFSVDVSVAKARNVVYFSGQPDPADLPGVPQGTAVTTRTLDFAAQPMYPGGIDGTQPGPFFPLFLRDLANPCTQGSQLRNANQNGIVFFPGSVPLYVNGRLAGGLGVSGDGVDQDDFVAAGGAAGFDAPTAIRADQIVLRDVRLTYQKFPRDPTL